MTKRQQNKATVHARQNAASWYKEIAAMVKAYQKADDDGDPEQQREAILESALDVCVRSDWHTPGGEVENTEYYILLSTGGPALRIRGTLDKYGQPDTAILEYQDWGTPWTEDTRLGHEDCETLLAFANHFYFGEGE